MRFTAGDTLFFERKDLGRYPVQLPFVTFVVIRYGLDPISKGRQGLFGIVKQYRLLDYLCRDFGLVGIEECDWNINRKALTLLRRAFC